MSLPVIAIVGRPNVGKSSLLNRLAGRRIAIVDPAPGVTRDRVSAPVQIGEGYAELVDTGGMGIEDADDLTGHVEEQIEYAVRAATVILWVLDARAGIVPLDLHVARRLRKHNKPVLLLANKVDNERIATQIGELNRLGFGEPLAVSALHGEGITELRSRLAELLGSASGAPVETVMKLAVVGKRNAGKSTFINAVAGSQRVIVSETPGTTRDSVDVTVELNGRRFTLIDTAGVRKRRKIEPGVEFYSYHRAMRSIRRADVVALLIDASVPVGKVDKQLAREIAAEFKPVVLVVNKWDLAAGKAEPQDYAEYLAKMLPEVAYAPISLTQAINGKNVAETIRLAEQLFDQANRRVTTGRLNAVMEQILSLRGPSHKGGSKPPKVLYASQVATGPPTIVLMVNDVRSFDTSYRRFLLNQLRDRLPFAEVPIRLLIRSRRRTQQRSGPKR